MAPRLPATLKLAELKNLAVACGLPSAGTKDVLASRVESAAWGHQRDAIPVNKQRILSVDLGIRNLAFSLLTPGAAAQPGRGARSPPRVGVEVWKRVALASSGQDALPDADKDFWGPSSMADLTARLVHDEFLALSPTHILIERQRFRSGGRAAVQEWTLRVNTLEAMIYATLGTLGRLHHWRGTIHSIAPARVGPFWLEGLEDDAAETKTSKATSPRARKLETVSDADGVADPKVKESKSAKSAKARNKKAKIDLVGKWLVEDRIETTGEAETTAKSYLHRWKGGRRNKTVAAAEDVAEHFNKLDDLADSLLQGLAWVKWQENQQLLAQNGPDELLGK
ncbi:hypothetical protein JX265_013082 [Neoarthrinium moseri]|uniref:SAP domain-containing protein n=1 Tax=Neoarthrinium moseri TaxID=1658444 RepID=A0A9P9W9R4_9PEZI|nr:hypothetical protein JX265_013082 [Neoarthrinium moseri]